MDRGVPEHTPGKMAEDAVPFTMEIASPDGRRIPVVCLDVVRAVEKTRTVYQALWEDRPVIVKVFTKWPKARYHAIREWRGLRQLEVRQLNTPKPLFRGRTGRGWAVVTERIENAITARELWDSLDTLEHKTCLLSKIGRQLARQHIQGVIQADLHLGNFLVRGTEIFILDPAMMCFRAREIGRRRSLKQLATLVSILPSAAPSAIETVFNEYAAARSWTISAKDRGQMHNALKRRRKSGMERGLRKFLRTNRRHQAIHQGPWCGLAERGFLNAVGVSGLTVELHEAVRQGQILKDGGTSFVTRTRLGGTEVVIKRYNHKGWLHALRHTLKGSRARRAWLHANRLHLLGIPTPQPLAYLDEYKGPLLWRSYFVTEFVHASPLHTLLNDDSIPPAQKRQIVDQVLRLLDRLIRYGISHGDTKHTNILYDGKTPVLTDLDGVHVDRIPWLRRRKYRRDKARFLRDVDMKTP